MELNQSTHFLDCALKNNSLAHALLFLGVNQKANEDLIGRLITCLLGTVQMHSHPNITWILSQREQQKRGLLTQDSTSSSSEIKIEQIRQLGRDSKMQSFVEGAQIFIILEGHRLTANAANALLKTLEEPGENRYLFICAPTLLSVLPTIRSRCQRIFVSGQPNTFETGSTNELFDQIGASNLEERMRLAEQLAKDKENLAETLKALANNTREPALLQSIVDAQQKINFHANPQLSLEKLFLNQWPAPIN